MMSHLFIAAGVVLNFQTKTFLKRYKLKHQKLNRFAPIARDQKRLSLLFLCTENLAGRFSSLAEFFQFCF